MYLVDESSFQNKSRSIRTLSTTSKLRTPSVNKKSEKQTCFGALGLNGNMTTYFSENSKKEDYIGFLGHLREREPKEKMVVLVDNAKIHHAHATVDFCNANGITQIFLPPYSPDLNPIEQIWRILKKMAYKSAFRTLTEIIIRVANATNNRNFKGVLKQWTEKFGKYLES
jgi:putative transposase